MGFCRVIKTKTKTNTNSASNEDNPYSDETSSSEEINMSIGFVSGNTIYNRVVFGSYVSTSLIIGSDSCYTCLCNRISRVNSNPTCLPELPTLNKINS
jgi:hypothetical protein